MVCLAGVRHLLVVEPVDDERGILNRHRGAEGYVSYGVNGSSEEKLEEVGLWGLLAKNVVAPQTTDIVPASRQEHIGHRAPTMNTINR